MLRCMNFTRLRIYSDFVSALISVAVLFNAGCKSASSKVSSLEDNGSGSRTIDISSPEGRKVFIDYQQHPWKGADGYSGVDKAALERYKKSDGSLNTYNRMSDADVKGDSSGNLRSEYVGLESESVALSLALDHLRDFPITTYRGIDLPYSRMLQLFPVGGIFQEKGFMSTTFSYGYATERVKLGAKPGNIKILMVVEGKRGKWIDCVVSLFDNQYEGEVLFQRKTKFKVQSIRASTLPEAQGFTEIHLIESIY